MSTPDRRRTIWVVDDSPTDADCARQMLAPVYDVVVMHDGAATLERLASGRLPDLLVLDWVMPGISGLEVCQYVRSMKGTACWLPILLLTVRRETQEIVQAFRSGANDHVSKPFVSDELHARVAALLEGRRLLERAEGAEAEALNLLQNAPDPTFAVDADGLISFVNTEGLRMLNRTSEQLLGTPFAALAAHLNLEATSVAPGEGPIPLPDVLFEGRVFSPSLRALPDTDGTTVSLREVTQHRQTEARRLDFYSIVAHELRTPIWAAHARLERALQGQHGVLPASLVDDLFRVEGNLESLAGMVTNFLELATLESDEYKLDRRPVDLSELIRATMEDFLPLLESRQLSWQQAGLEVAALVTGDRQRLAQVLSNLVSNAIKFTPARGTITTRTVVEDDFVEVSIEDTGRGIAHDELSTIFGRFTRTQDAAEETVGAGLGLMIVRELIQAHGGLVGVESELGRGSRFWLRLRRCDPAPAR